jgi:hypothetical protein
VAPGKSRVRVCGSIIAILSRFEVISLLVTAPAPRLQLQERQGTTLISCRRMGYALRVLI